MKGPELLAAHAGILRTEVGACWPGTRAVFRGHDLHKDLRDSDWLELYLLGITGRRFTNREIKLLHGIWVMTSYPDARLWNNRVAGLAGSARSTPILGLAGAQAVTEAQVYGAGPSLKAMAFFMGAAQAVAAGETLREFILRKLESGYIYGFGRPINAQDERLPWLIELSRSLELGDGKHLKLAFETQDILVQELGKQNLKMNYAGLVAALAADLGFSRREWHLFRFPIVLAGMAPCWMEASENTEGTLFPTPCTGIAYKGLQKRPWIR